MKMDLEKYLKEKRHQLDVDVPDENSVWEGVKAGMAKERKLIPVWFWKVAAIFLLVVSTTYVMVNEYSKKNQVHISLSDISRELGKQEAGLELIANRKWGQVQPFLKNNNSEIKFLLNELKELETIHKIYQQDLNEIGANDEIIRVLLDYHEKKIKILDRLLLETQKQKNHEEQITL